MPEGRTSEATVVKRAFLAGALGALLLTLALNTPRAYAQAMSGGISTSQILAALVGQDVTATRYTATASAGVGLKCNGALASCIDLGPGSLNSIGTNVAGDILLSDGVSGSATVRIGELTLYGNGGIVSQGYAGCNHNCFIQNFYAGEPVRLDDPDGVRISDSTAAALGTCTAALENTIKRDYASGGSTGDTTRLCLCVSDGAGTPAYAWQNLTTGTVGTSTTCTE
jgi:hypothetical protein